jgi:hypothetical protein
MTTRSFARARAQALFKKEKQAQLGQEAMRQYRADQEATSIKTARLRALRLARDGERIGTGDAADRGGALTKQPLRRVRPGLHQGVRGKL